MSASVHTLADQLLVASANINPPEKGGHQVLDNLSVGTLTQQMATTAIPTTQHVCEWLQVERERGITVKAQTASMMYTHTDGEQYLLNLIDTPGIQECHSICGVASLLQSRSIVHPLLLSCAGHVDFSYEVARSLAACQGALLLVDASQGVQAQTVANYHLAVSAGLQLVRGAASRSNSQHMLTICQALWCFRCQ